MANKDYMCYKEDFIYMKGVYMKRKTALFLAILFLLTLVSASGEESLGEPIRISYLQNDIHHLACWVALEKGFYVKEGLNVKIAGIFKAPIAAVIFGLEVLMLDLTMWSLIPLLIASTFCSFCTSA